VSPRKAAGAGKDWYSVSVETLKSWGLLLVILVVVVVGFFAYRFFDRTSLEREARRVMQQSEQIFEQLKTEKKLASFATEHATARASYEEARTRFAARDFHGALESGQRCLAVLQLILDGVAPSNGAGQANFIQVEGEVEFRRGDTGDWQEARRSIHLQLTDVPYPVTIDLPGLTERRRAMLERADR